MQKAKKYDWKDSNMALFGSDTEKQVKKESAESEPAWQGCGQEVGLKIWRIVKFQVESWPKEDYGEFYEGDSYIILNTYKEPEGDELKYDVHFWIGKFSTQDEYGTAAYKTVELDTFLDDKPIQHREVQGHESLLFKKYFPVMKYNKGGADTGFRRVLPEEYTPRLYHVRKHPKTKKLEMNEVALQRNKLTSADVFILDTGMKLYQWNGSDCSHDEKFKAAAELNGINDSRGAKGTKEVLEQDSIDDENHPFYKYLSDESDDDDDDEGDEVDESCPVMLRVSDADGSLNLDPVDGDVSKDNLTSDDVYVIDTKQQVFVWIGSGASIDERKNGLSYACNYVNKTPHPCIPISVVAEGKESANFFSSVAECA